MSSSDLYWLPSTAMVGYGWVWLFKNGGAWKPIRGRVILGLLGLLLATASCQLLPGNWFARLPPRLPSLTRAFVLVVALRLR
jgi:hypothetical protein